MADEQVVSKSLLEKLVGEQLSAVTFVQDYLQIDFDGLRMTLNVWPLIRSGRGDRRFGENGYRDDLCSFIGQRLMEVAETEAAIELLFSRGTISVDLLMECRGERVILEDTVTHAWVYW